MIIRNTIMAQTHLEWDVLVIPTSLRWHGELFDPPFNEVLRVERREVLTTGREDNDRRSQSSILPRYLSKRSSTRTRKTHTAQLCKHELLSVLPRTTASTRVLVRTYASRQFGVVQAPNLHK